MLYGTACPVTINFMFIKSNLYLVVYNTLMEHTVFVIRTAIVKFW